MARDTGCRCDGVRRRDVLKLGVLSCLGLSLADCLRLQAAGAAPSGRLSRRRELSGILIWLDGGPSHLDTFDLKPEEIRALADRHFGVGFDQLLVIEPPRSPDTDFYYRIFNRDGKKILGKRRPDPAAYPDANHDIMLEFLNNKDGAEWASLPVAVIYTKDLRELHRYIEYPAIYHKDRVRGFQQAARPGESDEQRRDRDRREFLGMQASPFFDIWASAAIDEVLTALHERRVLAGGAAS